MVEAKRSADPTLMTNINFCSAYLQTRDVTGLCSVLHWLTELLNNISVEGVEPLAIAHLMPIQAGSSDPRLREDEVNPFPEEVISSLSWPIDEETGMPRIPVQPGLYPWEIVSHL